MCGPESGGRESIHLSLLSLCVQGSGITPGRAEGLLGVLGIKPWGQPRVRQELCTRLSFSPQAQFCLDSEAGFVFLQAEGYMNVVAGEPRVVCSDVSPGILLPLWRLSPRLGIREIHLFTNLSTGSSSTQGCAGQLPLVLLWTCTVLLPWGARLGSPPGALCHRPQVSASEWNSSFPSQEVLYPARGLPWRLQVVLGKDPGARGVWGQAVGTSPWGRG